jgi:hypothetical protein
LSDKHTHRHKNGTSFDFPSELKNSMRYGRLRPPRLEHGRPPSPKRLYRPRCGSTPWSVDHLLLLLLLPCNFFYFFFLILVILDSSDELQFSGLSCDDRKNLKIFRSDPFDYQSIIHALKGCSGLFYTFEPPQDQPAYDVSS